MRTRSRPNSEYEEYYEELFYWTVQNLLPDSAPPPQKKS